MYGSLDKSDRWIITVDSEMAKRELLRGIVRSGEPILVRKYDDVIREEYQAFLKYKTLFSK